MNIYLVGYMGSGKSTVGKQLARMVGFSHLDLDDYFEETYKITVMDFFNKYDEAAFRRIESELLKKTFAFSDYVISTGGGTPCFNDNMSFINNNGISVYIQMNPKSLFDRLKHAKRPRPRTSNLSDQELRQRIQDDMQVREQSYLRAHLIMKGESINIAELAEKLKNMINPSLQAD